MEKKNTVQNPKMSINYNEFLKLLIYAVRQSNFNAKEDAFFFYSIQYS